MTKRKAKPYYDNNWQLYKDAPDEHFIPHTFEEFMEWKGQSWELPSSVACIIREQNTETFKVKEHVYRKVGAAANKVRKLLEQDNVAFTVVKHDTMHDVNPAYLLEDDFDDD